MPSSSPVHSAMRAVRLIFNPVALSILIASSITADPATLHEDVSAATETGLEGRRDALLEEEFEAPFVETLDSLWIHLRTRPGRACRAAAALARLNLLIGQREKFVFCEPVALRFEQRR